MAPRLRLRVCDTRFLRRLPALGAHCGVAPGVAGPPGRGSEMRAATDASSALGGPQVARQSRRPFPARSPWGTLRPHGAAAVTAFVRGLPCFSSNRYVSNTFQTFGFRGWIRVWGTARVGLPMPCDESHTGGGSEPHSSQRHSSRGQGSGRPRWVSGCSQVVTGLRSHLSRGRVSSELARAALGRRPRSGWLLAGGPPAEKLASLQQQRPVC